MSAITDLCPNQNLDTGIHYGCISQHSIDISAMDDWYDNDAMYDEIKDEIENRITEALEEYMDPVDISNVVDEAIDRFNENYQNDEPAYYYFDDQYEAEFSHSLVCWIIKKSPYYTYCKGCSPCVPNAGDLDSPVTPDNFDESNVPLSMFDYAKVRRAYCLPKEFFDDDKAPYVYFRVETGERVME
jgi:hypothetical protein